MKADFELCKGFFESSQPAKSLSMTFLKPTPNKCDSQDMLISTNVPYAGYKQHILSYNTTCICKIVYENIKQTKRYNIYRYK